MNLIDTGIYKGLIRFDKNRDFITYIHQNKKRNYNNPEEKVQAETFLTLALIYGYPVERIRQFVSVQMGSETKEADIVVYNDDQCEETYILVECKKEDLTDQQFNIAVDQAYSYAVAEDIGYDATGRNTNNNELIEISKELAKFIVHINETETI